MGLLRQQFWLPALLVGECLLRDFCLLLAAVLSSNQYACQSCSWPPHTRWELSVLHALQRL